MTWVADTSWLYALVDLADPHHAKARAQAAQPDPVEVPEVILAETLDLVRYRHGRNAAVQALDGFGRLPHFVLGESPRHAETVSVWRAHDALSYADAAAVAQARSRGYGLRSFDARQIRAFGGSP
ncbi:MAG TPA: PIN domain-containing protein [Candidatus Thermoplasmatota archaeon]